MVATLLTGAAGAGKTQAAIRRAQTAIRHDPFSTIWVLLPTDLQIANFQMRLLAELGTGVCFGVQTFNFYALYSHLLRIAGQPQRRVTDTARFRVLRHVLGTLQSDLAHFDEVCQTPGFIRVAADFIQELKRARIEPERFRTIAQSDKDRDLALIYENYQQFLRGEGLVDSEGEGWLALAELERQPDLDLGTDLLIIDGYDQFNIVQAELLGLLAARVPNTILTLTYEPARAETSHRRYAQTRERLLTYYSGWVEQPLEDALNRPSPRAECLRHLSQTIFEPYIEKHPHDETLSLIEAPDPRREVEYVLRKVKAALLNGVRPDDIAVLARNLSPYAIYVSELAPAYGVPIATRMGAPLGENPAVAGVLALLDLASNDFRRRAVMDALHNPYLTCPDLDAAQIDLLERISRTQLVTRGRATWTEAITRAGTPQLDEDGDSDSAAILTTEAAKALAQALDQFFERVTPPTYGTAREYVRWIETLIGPDPVLKAPAEAETLGAPTHFRVLEQIRNATGIDPAITARDLTALDCFKRVRHEMLAAYELIDAYEQITWEQFRAELGIAIDNTTVSPSRDQNRIGRVLVSSVHEARGLSHDTVYLLGLSEGSFPVRAAEDALYHDSERSALQGQGLALLTRAEDADESSLFYEVTALARQALILTRPYSEKGETWPESPYWRAVLNVVEAKVDHQSMNEMPAIHEAARLSEVVTAVANQLNEKYTNEQTLSVHTWLASHAEYAPRWRNALLGRRIEIARERSAGDAHGGRLQHPFTLTAVGEALGPDRVWSASQFNEYGSCPFKFFARRLLKLDPLTEPEDGLTPAQSGSLSHEILENTYACCGKQGMTITSANQTAALRILESVMDELFPGAPARHGFVAGTGWQQEQASIRRWLRDLVALDFSEESPIARLLPGERRPLQQEAGFGETIPIIIDGTAGPIRAQGYIDRMDVANGRVVVLDYKSGSQPFNREDMLAGRNVQMLLYILAARRLLHGQPVDVIGGAFWLIKKHKLSGEVTLHADETQLQEAQAALHERVIAGRGGEFPNEPSKAIHGKCMAHCEYNRLCRAKAE